MLTNVDRVYTAPFTCGDDEAQAVDERAGVGGVLEGGETVPYAGLLQGQAEAGQAPLEVHAERQCILQQPPGHHLDMVNVNKSLSPVSFVRNCLYPSPNSE